MKSEFDEFDPRKANEKRNPMKPKSSDLELLSERYPIFKINVFSDLKLGKMKNTMT